METPPSGVSRHVKYCFDASRAHIAPGCAVAVTDHAWSGRLRSRLRAVMSRAPRLKAVAVISLGGFPTPRSGQRGVQMILFLSGTAVGAVVAAFLTYKVLALIMDEDPDTELDLMTDEDFFQSEPVYD